MMKSKSHRLTDDPVSKKIGRVHSSYFKKSRDCWLLEVTAAIIRFLTNIAKLIFLLWFLGGSFHMIFVNQLIHRICVGIISVPWDFKEMLTELMIAALLLKISAHFLNCDASAACGQKLKLRLFCVDAGARLMWPLFCGFCRYLHDTKVHECFNDKIIKRL